ncbi:DUF4960 domain-containing protein [Confluentibacter flavum]|uniref:Uncharacterized protein n=1 Tax=Confluentibacter flavum TaxID=1909700 RepID=A0A2N3HKE0_9FLAO|nr:DUF4960 domain-containing protein [Confluentibacter flavum]PKQ45364.1 hypothetical protein CSW08_08315 [Confluentibacter flavum]
MKSIKTTSNRIFYGIIFFISLCITACDNEHESSDFNMNAPVQINMFNINGSTGTIDQKSGKINFQLPYGTSLVGIVPEIDIPNGAKITPGLGESINLTQEVKYVVINGNVYKDYTLVAKLNKPITSFKINGLSANINHNSKMISLILPEGTDLTSLQPEIELTEGVSISPQASSNIDFTNPVAFTVSAGNLTEVYTATITKPVDGPIIAFLGTSETLQGISNLDEITASSWLFENYPGAQYLSFTDIANGVSLNHIDVIWWHYDEAISLPAIALDASVKSALQTYQSNGGNLLLTTFASQYVEALNIVPTGKGPNNVFGDFLPNGFIDGNDWGMSFVGHENHPVFLGLETFASGKANLLEKGTFRLNHTAWWFLPEWGGYANGQGWRDQTGGNNLASEAWDDSLNGRVTIAEFPGGASDIHTVIISMGAYDWYNENDTNGNNGYLDNIKILTNNSLNYLVEN